MKKIALLLLALSTVIILFTFAVNAASGDVAGVYYATDIVTTLNGEEIRAISVRGSTCISAEDMRYYGFSVYWLGDTRELKIVTLDHAENGAPPKVQKTHMGGTVVGNYYETDIVTTLNNKPITAYNIGGETFISVLELRDFGFLVYQYSEPKIEIISPEFAGFEYSIRLTEGKAQTEDGIGAFSLEYRKDGITATGDAEYFTSSFHSTGEEYSFFLQFYQNEGLFYSGKLRKLFNSIIEEPDGAKRDALIRENIIMNIDGIAVNESKCTLDITPSLGNGHRDYYIEIKGLPGIVKEEIKLLSISVNKNEFELPFEIVLTETIDEKVKSISKELLKNPLDWVDKYYITEDFIAISIRESESLGVIYDRLYIYDCTTGEISADILDEVRKLDGYNKAELNLRLFRVDPAAKLFGFACKLKDENGKYFIGNFGYELATGKVSLISYTK